MSNNKLVSEVVMAAIVIILTGSVLVPICADAGNNATTTYDNIGDTARELDLTGEHTITVNMTSRTITVDDDQISFLAWRFLIVSDAFTIRAFGNDLAFYGVSPENSFQTMSGSEFTLTLDGNSGTATNGVIASPYTFEAEWIYIADPSSTDANIAVTSSASDIYLNSIEGFRGTGWSTSAPTYYFSASGKNATWMGSSLEAEYTTSPVRSGVVTIGIGPDNWDYSINNAGTDYTPQVLVVPHEVRDETFNGAIQILGIIPILIIAALLVAAVGIIAVRDRD